jgi:glucokinase
LIRPQVDGKLEQILFKEGEHGRFREYVESIPTTIIMNPDAAFLGLKSLAKAVPAR